MHLTLDRFGAITDVRRDDVWPAGRLAAEVARRAAILGLRGLAPGGYALIAHGGTPAFFADLFATWRAGACAVCINPGVTKGELATLVDFTAPAAVLVDGDGAGPDTEGLPVPVLDHGREPDAPHASEGNGALSLDDPAVILFTSGTTGEPKGVVHTHRSLQARIALNIVEIGQTRLSRTLSVLPTHFGHGLIGNCLSPLFAGGNLFLAPDMDFRSMAALGSLLTDRDIGFMSSVPSFWKIALKAAKPPGRASLQRVHIGSAPLSSGLWQDVIDWSGTRNVANAYGITETANWTAGASAAEGPPEDGLIGRMWGGKAAVRTEEGDIRAQGTGEILLQTPSVMRGYFRRDDLTAAVLRDGWYHTGDLGRIDPDGTLRLTGRAKHEINRAGIKISPEEVDLLLECHPQVVEACSFGVPDEISGEIVGAAVRLADGADVDGAALRTWCLARIRREGAPERWYFLPEIAKTDRGKIDRLGVRDRCLGEGGDR
ncbi:MAG: class I adenylate-forming enzyme family protein [Alphaproteobacteria bacterium]|nr:class I adenylate-forming enzyme family protein [Alphaproteobacteria bacterium]